MKFEFGKYTDVTEYAKKLSKENDGMGEYHQYEKILICPDTNDAWVARILVGYNEEYNKDEDKVLIERNKIDGMGAKYHHINIPLYPKKLLMEDMEEGEQWDVKECDSVDEALGILADIFGIIEETA